MIVPGKTMADTDEFVVEDPTSSASVGAGRVRVDCAGSSHKGNVRANNEDHFLIARFDRILTPLSTNILAQAATMFAEEGHGLVVADGMGGAAAGEMASKLAIRTLMDLIIQSPDWIVSSEGADAERVMARMAERFRRIDSRLREEAAKQPGLQGMGTTMTLAFGVGDCLVLTHIGDSRAYLFRAGVLRQLTHDHTQAQALVDQGFLKRTTDATRQSQRSLVRVLGGMGQRAEPDSLRLTLLDQDQILLCSDGLTDMVNDADIAALLAGGATAGDACSALIERALTNGGKDNVTVIVARYNFTRQPVP